MPDPGPDSLPYWQGLRKRRLLLQRCAACGTVRHYPRPVCARCHSMEAGWVEASGRGAVHSWTVCHHAFHPAFRDQLPTVLATVDLVEGVRMHAPLRGVTAGSMRIGMPVRVVFEAIDEQTVLPAFVRADR